MEKVIIDIDLLIEWSGMSNPENSQENLNSIMSVIAENNLQPYVFDFQAKHFEFNVLKSKFREIRIKIIEKEAIANAESVAASYESQFKAKLTNLEKISLLSYLSCGFTGIKFFLRKQQNQEEIEENSELSNKLHTFNLELIKI